MQCLSASTTFWVTLFLTAGAMFTVTPLMRFGILGMGQPPQICARPLDETRSRAENRRLRPESSTVRRRRVARTVRPNSPSGSTMSSWCLPRLLDGERSPRSAHEGRAHPAARPVLELLDEPLDVAHVMLVRQLTLDARAAVEPQAKPAGRALFKPLRSDQLNDPEVRILVRAVAAEHVVVGAHAPAELGVRVVLRAVM